MKTKSKVVISLFLILVLVFFLNRKFELIAFHPFKGEGRPELKVMTWNVHCSLGADSRRQKDIAELILKEGADLVLLNEFNQDSCLVIDSMLRVRYPFTAERYGHQKSGDVFYCNRVMSNTGGVYRRKDVDGVQISKATVAIGRDSVQVFGMHMASNHYDEDAAGLESEAAQTSCGRYVKAQERRRYQAQWAKKAVMNSGNPVILMGDMNDLSCSAPMDSLMSCGLIDSWWEGGNGYGCTYHRGCIRLRIDHIFHSKELKLEGIRVISTELSDHNPVIAGFRQTEYQ